MTKQFPMLNLGAGRVILPGDKPAHHALVPDAIYTYPLWFNVDRNPAPGIDCVMDLFTYPWPLEDNAYDGALLSHLVEHIGHEIRPSNKEIPGYPSTATHCRWLDLSNMQDGWFAFWSELYRVLTPGAFVHVLAPYGISHGWMGDPTHMRPIVEGTFYHSMKPDPDAPFEYATGGIHFEVIDPILYGLSPKYAHMSPLPTDPPDVQRSKSDMLEHLSHTQLNVATDIYCCLECVK